MSMSPHSSGTPARAASDATAAADPLAPLAALPGVADAVESVRTSVDRVYGHRVMRRRSTEVTAEAVLRGARASAALAGADWALEEVRRRSDFGVDAQARIVGASLRVTAEAGQLLPIWRQSPLRVLARLHLVAAGSAPGPAAGAGAAAEPSDAGGADVGGTDAGGADVGGSVDRVGRPRLAGEPVDEPLVRLELPDVAEMSGRLDGLAGLIAAGSSAPALVIAAVVHGELLALRPFGSHNGLIARAAERIVLVGSGLDPKSICPAEVGHAEAGRDGYLDALDGYASGTAEGMAEWIAHCGRAVGLGARESTAVCEAMQRGAA